jgi:hypothetical protein
MNWANEATGNHIEKVAGNTKSALEILTLVQHMAKVWIS